MRRSENKQPSYFFPQGLPSKSLGSLKRKGNPLIPRRETRLFSGKENRFGRVFFFLYLFIASIIVFLTLAHASPPRSRGARPIALGNGYTAVAGDAYSLFYNPAGLAEISQKEISTDYGRSHSLGESPRSDFNYLYVAPRKLWDRPVPLAIGLYGEQAALGATIFDLTMGRGGDAPVDRWTRGFIKSPVRLGAAMTLRSQSGEENSDRVGKSRLGVGFSGGAYVPLNRKVQLGFALRHLFLGSADPDGPSAHVGVRYEHRDFLHMMADLEYGSGGVWRIQPGFEWLLARGVLRPRLGWGFHDNGGVDSVATGVGFYVSPFQVDMAYLIPTKTLSDEMDQFRVSLTYRFGRPQFSEIYFDRALEQANKLDSNVLTLTSKEAELKNSLDELEQKRRIAQEDLNKMKLRIQTLKEQDVLGDRDAKIRQLQLRVNQLEGQLSNTSGEVRSLRQKKATVRTHSVKAGDTLQSLARDYYGDPNQWKKIYNANPDKIERGLPRAGAELVIP